MFGIEIIGQIPFNGFLKLKEISQEEGYQFLVRLEQEWLSGKNQFNQPGEGLFKISVHKEIVGIGGINQDPYSNNKQVGRIRRFYVHPSWRKKGIGTVLLNHIIDTKGRKFSVIQLRTDTEIGRKFYERNGFVKVSGHTEFTHRLVQMNQNM